MSTSISIPTTVNSDLQRERDGSSFSSEEFAVWWYGGAEKLKLSRDLRNYMLSDMNRDDIALWHYKSHEEICELALKQCIEAANKLRKFQEERNPGGTDYWPKLYGSPDLWGAVPMGNPLLVHYLMLVEALKTQSTPEQYEEFGKRAARFEICGTYAQTELGHGTFLRGLETRADYDRKTEEFVLNSPTLTSYKWWPGGLGHSSNYCIVVAQLYIDNEPKGVQMFFVQVRDEETHMPLPGIDIGEIGKKLGFFGVNNGYLGLKNVRVPRTRMLMANAKVLPDGTFVKSPTDVLTYFTMVYVRVLIGRNNALMLALSSTIATRYSAVRHQSPINAGEPEPQIIDHVTQQLKLFPEIANSVAYYVVAQHIWGLYQQTYTEIQNGNYTRLPEMHVQSCCLKVLCSTDSAVGVERLRLACGGHGYLLSSNLSNIYSSATAACTYEGENTVLLLQVGRYLMKSWRSGLEGKPLEPAVAYLAEVQNSPTFGNWTGEWANIVSALKFTAAHKIRLAFNSLGQRLNDGASLGEAGNKTGIELTQAAELHGRAYMCEIFLLEVTGPNAQQRSPQLNKVLENLLELFVINTTLNLLGSLLRFINLTNEQVCVLQRRLEEVLAKIRPDAVAIVDGFDFMDNQLNSTLGSYDGNVYERIFEAAQKSPLNQQPVPKSFREHLKPFLKSNL